MSINYFLAAADQKPASLSVPSHHSRESARSISATLPQPPRLVPLAPRFRDIVAGFLEDVPALSGGQRRAEGFHHGDEAPQHHRHGGKGEIRQVVPALYLPPPLDIAFINRKKQNRIIKMINADIRLTAEATPRKREAAIGKEIKGAVVMQKGGDNARPGRLFHRPVRSDLVFSLKSGVRIGQHLQALLYRPIHRSFQAGDPPLRPSFVIYHPVDGENTAAGRDLPDGFCHPATMSVRLAEKRRLTGDIRAAGIQRGIVVAGKQPVDNPYLYPLSHRQRLRLAHMMDGIIGIPQIGAGKKISRSSIFLILLLSLFSSASLRPLSEDRREDP